MDQFRCQRQRDLRHLPTMQQLVQIHHVQQTLCLALQDATHNDQAQLPVQPHQQVRLLALTLRYRDQ